MLVGRKCGQEAAPLQPSKSSGNGTMFRSGKCESESPLRLIYHIEVFKELRIVPADLVVVVTNFFLSHISTLRLWILLNKLLTLTSTYVNA